MSDKEKSKESPFIEEDNKVDSGEGKNLVLHNDDVHTFDYVIESLIDVCSLSTIQAEQCTYIVHYKGKCDVKKGSYDDLNPMRNALIDKGLNATID